MKLKLETGDRICFFGDSITSHGWYIKEIFEHFKNNHPELKIGFYNCGIPGSKGYEANLKDRMYADLLGYFPKYTFVMFGMNDVCTVLYSQNCKVPGKEEERQERLHNYPNSLENIIEICQKAGTEPIICSPTVYDEYSEFNTDNHCADEALAKCAELAKIVAEKHNLMYIDMRTPLLNNLHRGVISEDRVHPTQYGHHIMAQTILKAISEIDSIDSENDCKCSKINNERFMVEQKLRNIMMVERDIMGWQYIEDMPVAQRKRLVEEDMKNLSEEKLWRKDAYSDYLENADYCERLRGELIKLTMQMYD